MDVKFRVLTAEVEEEHGQGRAARAICRRNALAKAFAVAKANPKETVLGADTLVHLGDALLGKPASMAEAQRMLGRLSGQTHQVTTACALVQGERRRVFSVTTRVRFRELSARQINAYLKAVPVLDKAGAYAVQEKGEWIVEAVYGSLTNVVGLPVERLGQELRAWFDTASARP
ncbi:MAG: Maf family protein [Pedosphaera sp.]|nr:Maf family protein [Pedosphaera sp.]